MAKLIAQNSQSSCLSSSESSTKLLQQAEDRRRVKKIEMLPNQSNTSQSLLSTSETDNSAKIEQKIMQDSFHQARFSSKATIGFIIASTFVNILGIGLLFFGKVPEAAITTASGLTSNILSALVMLNKENNERCDRLAKQFKDEN